MLAGPAVVDHGARRIFHITHQRNLESILGAGRILADAAGAVPVVDISSSANREARRAARVGDLTVAHHVPFFLNPGAFLWERIRDSDADPRLAETAHARPASDFVILVSTVGAAGELAVVADGDAAGPSTRFSALAESGGTLPRRLHDDEDAIREAELLVPMEFPLSAISLIGVANDRVRTDVRTLLNGHDVMPKVSVYPPWFQPTW